MCLKTGCRVEQSQLNDRADLERCSGFAAPIAVRLLHLRQHARQTPEVLATTVVEPLLVAVLARRQRRPAEQLTLAEFWRAVAKLGGHQGRRRDGPPGWRPSGRVGARSPTSPTVPASSSPIPRPDTDVGKDEIFSPG